MTNSFLKALTNLFSKPKTIDYPNIQIAKDKRYRGLIEYEEKECIYCLRCEKACPPGAILFVRVDNPPQNEKNKKGLKYYYNPNLCIYCHECVRACPKPDKALWQSSKKPNIATAKDRVNDGWFELERLKKETKA